MAHLRKHKRSPFWYVRRRNIDSGEWCEVSTGLRIDNDSDTRKAQRVADKYSIEEKRIGTPGHSPAFNAWVPSYLAQHWRTETGSKRRYQTAWQALSAFLRENGVIYPRQVRYAHGSAYLRWRMANPVHGRKVGHNTALLEIKFLSQLINEAIRREFCESNPIAKLGIGRVAQKEKPELTDTQIATLRARLSSEPEWMRTCFEISLYTGCRFSECQIPMRDIDLATCSMRLRDSKRKDTDPRKYFTVPIHPSLAPVLAKLSDSGEVITCLLSRDKNGRINYFFRQCGVEASFHSLRVTFVTRCHRAGLSEAVAMRMVNHSSQLVHKVYSRLKVEDVRHELAKIDLPGPSPYPGIP